MLINYKWQYYSCTGTAVTGDDIQTVIDKESYLFWFIFMVVVAFIVWFSICGILCGDAVSFYNKNHKK